MAQTPIVNAGLKYVNDLNMTYVDDENVTVAAGECRDSTNVTDIQLTALTTVNIAVNGVNGLDTGTVANGTFYALYVIGDSTKKLDSACVFSANTTTPGLPFGYDVFRRIGFVLTDGSADIVEFSQYGNGTYRDVFYADSSVAVLTGGTATSFTEVDLSAFVPPIKCVVYMDTSYDPQAATSKARLAPFGSGSTNGSVVFGYGSSASQRGPILVPSALDGTSPKILYKVDNASDNLDLLVGGYIDVL